ncbi:MAG: hypothetical protein ACREHG_00055, partial [Candidatus Saccharimonadales bacterium]
LMNRTGGTQTKGPSLKDYKRFVEFMEWMEEKKKKVKEDNKKNDDNKDKKPAFSVMQMFALITIFGPFISLTYLYFLQQLTKAIIAH